MKATSSHNCLRLCVLSCLFVLHISTRVAGNMPSPSHVGVASREVSRNRHPKQRNSYFKPLRESQTEDEGMRLMLSLYRIAADADGRPKQLKLFGSNTIRLLKASTTEKHFLPTSNGKALYLILYTSITFFCPYLFAPIKIKLASIVQ